MRLIVSLLIATLAAQGGVHPISGRPIAPVMGWQGAAWLERDERIEEERPDAAIRILSISKGSTVADIGAGTGYMSIRLAAAVGPEGRVFANDLQPQMIQMLRQRLAAERISNVIPVQGVVDDPKLPAPVDLALMVDVYHELSHPQAMLRRLRESLKPGGRLVLLEYRKEDPAIPIRPEHKMTIGEVKMEVEAEGFKLSDVNESLPRQHILIFTIAVH